MVDIHSFSFWKSRRANCPTGFSIVVTSLMIKVFLVLLPPLREYKSQSSLNEPTIKQLSNIMSNILQHITGNIKHWWISIIIGTLSILIGFWCIFTPLAAFEGLVDFFEILFIVCGLSEVIFAFANRNIAVGWGWNLTAGLIDILLGIILLSLPQATVGQMLIYLVGFWIMFRSFWTIGLSVDLQSIGIKGWWAWFSLSVLSLILSVVFIFGSPLFGGTFIVVFVALALICYGIFRIGVGICLHRVSKGIDKLMDEE